MLPFPTRRSLLQASAALLAAPAVRSTAPLPVLNPALIPSSIKLFSEGGARPLARSGENWTNGKIEVTTKQDGQSLKLTLRSPEEHPVRLAVRWVMKVPPNLFYLGDAWERSYGDLAFRNLEPERILPWYVIAADSLVTHAFGVKTGTAALCFWQVDPEGISLWCDLRNGGRAVQLGTREVAVAEVVARTYTDRNTFHAAQDFCRVMCEKPRFPNKPIYGGNNWYYAYGKSSSDAIRRDSERVASVSEGLKNRPVMLIDDGWQPYSTAGPWRTGNAQFPDMTRLAADMRAIGVKPALWTRPLFTREFIPEAARLASPNAQAEFKHNQSFTLDPTAVEAAPYIQDDLQTVISWGFELIKHDFSTYDLLGRWGFNMNAAITDDDWNFRDRSITNAEVIRNFYLLLRKAAGETPLLGCNTMGHLAAGIFEAQRTGDDTSGKDWNRTRKMGVNTLAFRMPQHNAFFAIDADCVGLTKDIDWKWNRQWLDLLAHSGTPLFVSIAPDALGKDQSAAIKEAFRMASEVQPVAEPMDWLTNSEPQRWLAKGTQHRYDWFGQEGASPFGM